MNENGSEKPSPVSDDAAQPITPGGISPGLLNESDVRRTLICKDMASRVDGQAQELLGRLMQSHLVGEVAADARLLGKNLWADLLNAGWIEPDAPMVPDDPHAIWPMVAVELVRSRCHTCGLAMHGTAELVGRSEIGHGAGNAHSQVIVEIEHTCEVAMQNWRVMEEQRQADDETHHQEQRHALIKELMRGGMSYGHVVLNLDAIVVLATQVTP